MLAAAETTAASDMGCKRRRSPAMAEEKPGCEAAEESRGGAAGEEGCTAREEGWTAGAAEEEDVCGGCSIEEGRLCCRGRCRGKCMLAVVGRLPAVRKVG